MGNIYLYLTMLGHIYLNLIVLGHIYLNLIVWGQYLFKFNYLGPNCNSKSPKIIKISYFTANIHIKCPHSYQPMAGNMVYIYIYRIYIYIYIYV